MQAPEIPAEAKMVTLDADGESLPSDWYLRVARETGRMLRREIPLSPQMPLLGAEVGVTAVKPAAPNDERRVFHAGP